MLKKYRQTHVNGGNKCKQLFHTLKRQQMIAQADSDVWGRLECFLVVGEAVAGLNADAPAAGLLFLMDGG